MRVNTRDEMEAKGWHMQGRRVTLAEVAAYYTARELFSAMITLISANAKPRKGAK